jgi:hypothetical protein
MLSVKSEETCSILSFESNQVSAHVEYRDRKRRKAPLPPLRNRSIND